MDFVSSAEGEVAPPNMIANCSSTTIEVSWVHLEWYTAFYLIAHLSHCYPGWFVAYSQQKHLCGFHDQACRGVIQLLLQSRVRLPRRSYA
jgi:hypothetical protein